MAPFVCRVLIYAAGWIAPPGSRAGWRGKWRSRLANWQTLVERGEFPRFFYAEMVRYSWGAFPDALQLRLSRASLVGFVRRPEFVMLAAGAILFLTGLASRGFQGLRALARLWSQADFGGQHTREFTAADAAQNTIVAYMVPVVIALAIAVVLLLISRLPLYRSGWRYTSFLLFKTIAAALIVPAVWIESAAVVRAPLAGFLLGLAFIYASARTLIWLISDQRRRCPVCLRHLAMPVRMGSWASVFDPVTTEFFCDQGHGLLYVPENDAGPPERWAPLDETWRDLFEPAAR